MTDISDNVTVWIEKTGDADQIEQLGRTMIIKNGDAVFYLPEHVLRKIDTKTDATRILITVPKLFFDIHLHSLQNQVVSGAPDKGGVDAN